MKEIAKKKGARQEATPQQLMLAAMADIKTTLHEAIVAAGMTALTAVLEEERAELCGPRYARDSSREMIRAGSASGELAFGGRLVSVRRPRVRSAEGHEVPLKRWERFSEADPLTPRAVEQMVLGVSTRNYGRSLEPAPAGLPSRGTSKSAVSRRFVEATTEVLREMQTRDLAALSICAAMIDGIHVADHLVLVAMGIDEVGIKHILGLYEGATENATVCTALLSDLAARGLRTDRAMLFVIDGAKALRKAIRDVFGERALVQRCQVHKRRNVEDHLPESLKKTIGKAMTAAYRSGDFSRAKRILEGLARQLEKSHPAAAASLREGLDETLTVTRIGLRASLARTLSTTNAIEFINGRIRKTTHNVDKWSGGTMVLRWLAIALNEAAKTFRKLAGHADMPKLVAALRLHDQKLNPASVDASTKAA